MKMENWLPILVEFFIIPRADMWLDHHISVIPYY